MLTAAEARELKHTEPPAPSKYQLELARETERINALVRGELACIEARIRRVSEFRLYVRFIEFQFTEWEHQMTLDQQLVYARLPQELENFGYNVEVVKEQYTAGIGQRVYKTHLKIDWNEPKAVGSGVETVPDSKPRRLGESLWGDWLGELCKSLFGGH